MKINFLLRSFLMILFELLTLFVLVRQFFVRKKLSKKWRESPQNTDRVQSYLDLKPSLEETYHKMDKSKFWAKTSGTREEPKKIPYNKKRIKDIQRVYMESMMILTSQINGFKTFFVFASLEADSSLTAGLVSENKTPGLMTLLQAPYRYLYSPAGKSLVMLSGQTAARLILLIVTRPRFIYSTNPSTLVHFLDEVKSKWPQVQEGIRALLNHPKRRKEVLRLADGEALKRLEKLLTFASPPETEVILEKLLAIITWDGGYVGAFLNRLRVQLPGSVRILPMYSMSTEVLETIPHRINGVCVYGAFQEEILAEFMSLDGQKILRPHELIAGECYSLIVTDQYGLKRYDTEDIFEVIRIVDGFPDLRFKRRRMITASLTGEKITEEQVKMMTRELQTEFPQLAAAFITLFPVSNAAPFGYCLGLIGASSSHEIEMRSEELLCTLNSEYRDKVASGRLRKITCRTLDVNQLAKLMGQDRRWESQFKLMPLYERPVVQNF